ncbi:hypothetical protein ACQKWADRAFT_298632 [Trichoderma austrokoningii]
MDYADYRKHFSPTSSSHIKQAVGRLIPRRNQCPVSLLLCLKEASNFRVSGNQSLNNTLQRRIEERKFTNTSGEIATATGPTATATPGTWKREGVKIGCAK